MPTRLTHQSKMGGIKSVKFSQEGTIGLCWIQTFFRTALAIICSFIGSTGKAFIQWKTVRLTKHFLFGPAENPSFPMYFAVVNLTTRTRDDESFFCRLIDMSDKQFSTTWKLFTSPFHAISKLKELALCLRLPQFAFI